MSDLKKAQSLLKSEYSRIWGDWYDDRFAPANLEIRKSLFASCFGISVNIIYLNLPESNLKDVVADEQKIDDYSISGLGWNLWRRELIHEMLHEYQYKVVRRNATQKGHELYSKFKNKFDGNGHGPDYFTAIAEKADYFSLTPEELIINL